MVYELIAAARLCFSLGEDLLRWFEDLQSRPRSPSMVEMEQAIHRECATLVHSAERARQLALLAAWPLGCRPSKPEGTYAAVCGILDALDQQVALGLPRYLKPGEKDFVLVGTRLWELARSIERGPVTKVPGRDAARTEFAVQCRAAAFWVDQQQQSLTNTKAETGFGLRVDLLNQLARFAGADGEAAVVRQTVTSDRHVVSVLSHDPAHPPLDVVFRDGITRPIPSATTLGHLAARLREWAAWATSEELDFKPASWFNFGGKKDTSILRHAAQEGRKTKRVRSKLIDGEVCYCVEDVRQWYPQLL